MTTTLDIPRRPRQPAGPRLHPCGRASKPDPSRERLATPATVVTFVRTLGAVVVLAAAAATQASQTFAGGRAPQELAVAQTCVQRPDQPGGGHRAGAQRQDRQPSPRNADTKLDVHSHTQLQAALSAPDA